MLVRIPQLLSAAEAASMRARLEAAGDAWIDGRATAGHQAAAVKQNRQIDEASVLARELGVPILSALERSGLFVSAALPNRVYPPMFNRYDSDAGMQYGDHVDNAVRMIPGTPVKIRTDVSATLFLTPPDHYDGGELVIHDTYGSHSVKLAAGDLVVYPGSSLHRVTPVTRGSRISAFLWIQSLVRDDAQRALLFELDGSIQRLNATQADAAARARLASCYHNLLRMWSDPG